MKFSDIPGHSGLKAALRNLVDTDRIPHAVMISGISGIGKMCIARAFVQYIHCTDRTNGEPCGKCAACVQHRVLSHPDTYYVYPIVANKSKGIETSADMLPQWKEMLEKYPLMQPERWLEVIDAGNSQPLINVRDSAAIVNRAALSSYSSRYKVFVIWQPEKLNAAAANKLLKVIEEPDPDTLFVLVSNDEHGVLPTIFSRTQRFVARPLSTGEITQYLIQRYQLNDAQAGALADLAGGNAARADELGSHSAENEEFGNYFREMMRCCYGRKLLRLSEMAQESSVWGREKLKRFLEYSGRMIRENFIYNLRNRDLETMTRSEEEFASRFSPFVNHGNVEDIEAEIDRAYLDISRNANARITLFSFYLKLIPLLLRKPRQ